MSQLSFTQIRAGIKSAPMKWLPSLFVVVVRECIARRVFRDGIMTKFCAMKESELSPHTKHLFISPDDSKEISRLGVTSHKLVPHGANPKAGAAGELSVSDVGMPTNPPVDFNHRGTEGENPGSPARGDARPTTLVRRCLWCRERIGAPSYFTDGEWVKVFCQERVFGDEVEFTDGICPDCVIVQRRKEKVRG
jgi:hypothetical protein